MPGLVGLISDSQGNTDSRREKIEKMVSVMRHEPFYSYGTHFDENLSVGWTCHEGSFADCMPIYNERRDLVLFLAGEIYPEPSLRDELRRRGHEFAEQDATYLIHLYEELGVDFLRELNGCFSGFLIDDRTGRALLFTDRFGMHRVFTHAKSNEFYFSSEAKSLLAILPETREFDPNGLCEFITCGCTLGSHSLFKDICVLDGGTVLEFAEGALVSESKYFDPKEWENQSKLTKEESIEQFSECFPRIVRKYFYNHQLW